MTTLEQLQAQIKCLHDVVVSQGKRISELEEDIRPTPQPPKENNLRKISLDKYLRICDTIIMTRTRGFFHLIVNHLSERKEAPRTNPAPRQGSVKSPWGFIFNYRQAIQEHETNHNHEQFKPLTNRRTP